MKRLFLLIFILTSALLFAETDKPEENSKSEAPVDRQRQVLLYGIDSEVLDVLSSLQSEGVDTYNPLLKELLGEIRNPDIRSKIFQLWEITKWEDGVESAENELRKVLNDDLYDVAVIQAAAYYLAQSSDKADIHLLAELSEARDSRIAATAVRSIGKIAEKSSIPESEVEKVGEPLLQKFLKEDAYEEDELTAALIVTLGKLKYTPSADALLAVAEDEGSPGGHRRFACVSVGKIGRPEDYESIEQIYFTSKDANLRAYALAGIAEFPRDSSDILVQALKRDSFWRIRLTAAEKLGNIPAGSSAGEKLDELLRYKASIDPVKQVRMAAMKSLGKRSGTVNDQFLIDYYADINRSPELRIAALDILTENKIKGSVEAVSEILNKLWVKDSERFMEFTCRNLSRSEWDELAPLFERMLDHPNWLIQVYGVRGIRKNGLSKLEARVQALDNDKTDGRLVQEIHRGNPAPNDENQ